MEAREFTKQELRRNAAIVVAVIVVFSACLITGVRHLDEIARLMPQSQSEGTIVEQLATEVEAQAPATDCPTEPFYVLVIGSDTRQGTALYTGKGSAESGDDGYADVITLVRVDPSNWQITLVSIPRDTILPGQKEKINATLLGNHPEDTVRAAEKLTGVHIDYYLLTTFLSFEHLVNDLGGVTVDVPQDISFADPITAETVSVKAGKDQQLNGAQALVLARVRKAYGDAGDVKRQENVRNLEVAIVQKCTQHPELAASVLGSLDRYVDTNLDANLFYSLVSSFVEYSDDMVFYSCTGPFDGGVGPDGVWAIEADEGAWAALMASVDAGEDPAHALQNYYQERAEASVAKQQEQEDAAEDEVANDSEEETGAEEDVENSEENATAIDDASGEDELSEEETAV